MAATIVVPTRVFKFNGLTFPDVDPGMSPQQVFDQLAVNYPFLATAVITGPEISPDGAEIAYKAESPPAQTKGLHCACADERVGAT